MSGHALVPPHGNAPLRLTAGCKVNLGLRITRVRPDGYHELDSLFLPLDEPADQLELTVLPDAAPGIAVFGGAKARISAFHLKRKEMFDIINVIIRSAPARGRGRAYAACHGHRQHQCQDRHLQG